MTADAAATKHATQKELLCCKELIYLALRILSACAFTHKDRASIESSACTYRSGEPLPTLSEFGKIRMQPTFIRSLHSYSLSIRHVHVCFTCMFASLPGTCMFASLRICVTYVIALRTRFACIAQSHTEHQIRK